MQPARWTLLWICALGAAAGAGAQSPSLQGLASVSPLSRANAVSADGRIVAGQYRTLEGNDIAFRWTAETGMVGLGSLPGGAPYSEAFAVSADGGVVVGLAGSVPGDEAFRWTAAGGMVGLGYLPGGNPPGTAYTMSSANGLSVDGAVVVGWSWTGPNGRTGAFRWTADAGMTQLNTLSDGIDYAVARGVSADGAVIVGFAGIPEGIEATRWTADGAVVRLGDIPGGSVRSAAAAVSADGRVAVGYGSVSDAEPRAVRWTLTGSPEELGSLPDGSVFLAARAVSADGAVVVGQSRGATTEAVRWTAATGTRTIASLLAEAGVDVSDWVLRDATGISADGRVIVGFGFHRTAGRDEAWRAVLPLTTVSTDGSPNDATDLALIALPNPLRDHGVLRFTLPEAGAVRLFLHDVLGREISVVFDGWRASGSHEAAFDVSELPAGVYVARLVAGAQAATQRVTVVR